MKTSKFSFFTVLSFLAMSFSFTMCSTETEEKTATEEISEAMDELQKELKKAGSDAQSSVSEALSKVEDAMKDLKKDNKIVEPVNFRVLKSGIPETFLGMERTNYEGETAGAMGFKISTAKATFQDGDRRVDIEIIDVGGIGMAAMGMAVWSLAEIDKESDEGFERTTTYEGYKAFEKCRNDKCEFSTWMNQRIIFSVKSKNVGMDDIKRGLKRDVDLEDLMEDVADEIN